MSERYHELNDDGTVVGNATFRKFHIKYSIILKCPYIPHFT